MTLCREGSQFGGPVLGPGLECSCHLATLAELVKDSRYWKMHGDGTYTFILGSTQTEIHTCTTYMTTCSRFLAFSLLNLGQGFVMSPWVILAIVAGRDTFHDLTLEQIRSFSESDAVALADWFSIAPETRVVPASPQYASVRGLFTEALSSDVGGSDVRPEVGWSDSSHLDHYSHRVPRKRGPPGSIHTFDSTHVIG